MPETLYHFIGGRRVTGDSGAFADVFNPATGEVSSRVPLADARDVGTAIAAAEAAFPAWAATPPLRRARVMFRLKDLIEQHMDELAGSSPPSTARSSTTPRG